MNTYTNNLWILTQIIYETNNLWILTQIIFVVLFNVVLTFCICLQKCIQRVLDEKKRATASDAIIKKDINQNEIDTQKIVEQFTLNLNNFKLSEEKSILDSEKFYSQNGFHINDYAENDVWVNI